MSLDYRTLPFPATWPGKATPSYQRKRSQFKSNWGGTLALLERELRHLNAKDVTLAIGVQDRDIRLDGGVRADARIREPGVVLSFRSGPDQLTFPCDTYDYWQDNVRAIALALQALRTVDRYGVQQGRQYQGFKALPSSTSPVRTSREAAQFIVSMSGSVNGNEADDVARVLIDRAHAQRLYRMAANREHPDRGGDTAQFAELQSCKRTLEQHHGCNL